MSTADNIDDLKVHRIEPETGQRRSLPVAGQPNGATDDESEAWGGSDEVAPEPVELSVLEDRIVAAIRTVYDPEIPINVYDLGLIYGFDVNEKRDVEIEMTLTAPACPVAGMLVSEVARKVGEVDGVRRSHVKLVWDPPWTRERMSEAAMLELGLL